eukprot:UN14760
MWKIGICSVNVIFNRTRNFDPITNAFRNLARWGGIHVDQQIVDWVCQFGSFAFIGVLVGAQIRGLYR